MALDNSKVLFREYCLQQFKELRHSHEGASSAADEPEIEACIDVLEGILAAPSSPRQLQGIETQFYSALKTYLTLSRASIGGLLNAVDRLSGLIDPFLKKIAYHFLGDRRINKQTRAGETVSIELWKTSNYADILQELGIISVTDLYKEQKTFWKSQSAEKSILRKGFTLRHQGVHEARIHTLSELEDAAYFVVAQYIVICLHILHDAPVEQQVKSLTEKTRVLYLLREKVRSFSLTRTLLSRKEHLLIYKHRADIEPDLREKKYLFLNQLAGRGPSSYWLVGDEELAIGLAKEYWENPVDDTTRQNAARYLLKRGVRLPLAKLVDVFDEYSNKTELADYIGQCFTLEDRQLLLRLALDKREEVSIVAFQSLLEITSRIEPDVVRWSLSSSDAKMRIFRAMVEKVADVGKLDEYRDYASVKGAPGKIICIYSLGAVGNEQDAVMLEAHLNNGRVGSAVRKACWFAIARIWSRTRHSDKLAHLLKSREYEKLLPCIDAVSRDGLGNSLRPLLRLASSRFIIKASIDNALIRITQPRDRKEVLRFIKSSGLGNATRNALLALCKIGDCDDCRAIFNLIGKSREEVRLRNHVRIVDAMAKICDESLKESLKGWLHSPEFWGYIHSEEPRTQPPLPIVNPENQALIRRLIAICFLNTASGHDKALVKRLMFHNYTWIAGRAASKFAEIGNAGDIDSLLNKLYDIKDLDSEDHICGLDGLIALDERLAGI